MNCCFSTTYHPSLQKSYFMYYTHIFTFVPQQVIITKNEMETISYNGKEGLEYEKSDNIVIPFIKSILEEKEIRLILITLNESIS